MFYRKPYCTTSFMNKSSLYPFHRIPVTNGGLVLGFAGNGSNDILNDWMLFVPTSGAVCSGKASEYLQRRSGSAEDAENVENPIRFVTSFPDSPPKKREETNVWKWFLYVIVL